MTKLKESIQIQEPYLSVKLSFDDCKRIAARMMDARSDRDRDQYGKGVFRGFMLALCVVFKGDIRQGTYMFFEDIHYRDRE